MSKIYDSSGKARKLCPSCGKYCHARALNCPNCNHKFREGKSVTEEKIIKQPVDKKEPTVYNEGGRGRKQCQNCHVYVSVRLLACPKCNQVITKNIKEEKPKKETVKTTKPVFVDDINKKYVGKLVFAPVGNPPYSPDENIESWCTSVFADGLKNGITYSNQALWYWYQTFNNDQSSRNRIWEWSKREGFDKMQECSEESVLPSGETEADTLFLLDTEE